MRRLCLLLICLTLPLSLIAQAQKLPSDIYASQPDISSVKLSPDGNQIAYLVRFSDEMGSGKALALFDTNKRAVQFPLTMDSNEFDARSVRWVDDRYLLISAFFAAKRFNKDSLESRLLIFDTSTGESEWAFSRRDKERYFKAIPQYQHEIIDIPGDGSVLIGLSVNGGFSDTIFQFDVKENKLKKLEDAEAYISGFMADRQHRIRIAAFKKDNERSVLYRTKESDDWKPLWSYEYLSDNKVNPVGFGADPDILYITADHNGFDALFRVNLKDPDLTRDLVYSESGEDFCGDLVYSSKKNAVVGLSLCYSTTFWDTELKGLQSSVDNLLPSTYNQVSSLSDDENKYLLLSSSSGNPGMFYFGNRDTGKLFPFAKRFESLDFKSLAQSQSEVFNARDGAEISVNITYPQAHSGGTKVPAVIIPYSGYLRAGGYNLLTQMLVNRGYAVLDMTNSDLSSRMYGPDNKLQGWGFKSQTDIEDATRWLISKDYVDNSKICILGQQYGGYASLLAAVKSTDLYTCSISVGGVTDLDALVKSRRKTDHKRTIKKWAGTEYGGVEERSPINGAEKIQAAVLLIHPEDDRRVDVEQSRNMESALKKAKKDVQYIEIEGGSYNLTSQTERDIVFNAIDDFLAEHLK